MRYEDASSSLSQAAGAPDARDDADALAAGSSGPATGNTITGAGTITGTAGADIVTNGPGQIVALEGAGGSDTGEGGSLHVAGRFGELTMDSRGGYSYEPSSDSPNGGVDVFRYTLADGAGARDTATLTIEIGRELEEVQADAQQIIPGPDGLVTLPPGVELSDIQVVGRNLVITLPDGSQMVIIDGAVFVPQLVLGGVEVPASNLAALLIDSEPQPAAGTPLSSGGNFAVDVPPLDPGVPLGDLIPPTELSFPEPTFEDVGQTVDEEPEIFIQPDGQPASVAAVDSVDEAGLPARPVNEPAGSNAAADSETTTGTILVNSPDDPSVVTINGTAVTAVGQVIAGAHGTLTITSISDTAIGYSYTLTDNTSGDATSDNFSVTVTDNDGDTATATLTINIVDDVPTARNDTDASVDGVATGNVITDAAPGDVGDSDTDAADTVGADNATLTSVTGFGGSSDSTFSEGVLTVDGQFGTLVIDAQGNYTYTVNPNAGGGGVDVFTYTLTDGDGDTSTATLTITNPDLFPETDPNPVVRTDDDAVPGADGNPGTPEVGDDIDAENLSGTLSGSGGDGALTFDLLTTGAPAGFTYVDGPDGSILVQQGGTTVLTITVNASTGAYTVTQNAPIDHPDGGEENNLSFTINYTVTDADGDSAPGTLVINVDDDTPVIGRLDVSAPTLTVDETDLATNATGNFSTLFAVDYGADGAGTTVFAVTVVDGTDSGLMDVATGQSIFLFNDGGVVEGRVGGVDGEVAFTVSVNSTTGVVTLDQVRALDHPDATDPNDPVSPDATSIQLTVTATDGDEDPVNETINIGGSLVFEDDGPAINANGTQPTLTVDETVLATNATANFAGVFGASFGADGAGLVTYSLGINAGATGLVDTATGLAVVLTVEGSQVVGRVGPAGPIVFTVSVDADGNVTLDQQRAVVHDDPSDHDEATSPATLAADNLITLNATVTDGDGDTATATANIGQNLNFEDDGPSLSNVVAASGVTLDETSAGSPDGFPIFLTSGSAMISATQAFGADGAAAAGSVVYGLSLTGDVSSLASGLQTAIGDFPITLVQIDADTIQGQYQDGGTQVAFTVQMNADGTVTLTQEVPLEHLVDGPEGPAHDDPLDLGGLINATITIKDGDGDTASASAGIGDNLVFEDDGPSIIAGTTQPTLAVDETILTTNATASFAGVFSADYGADGAAAANAIVYTLGVNAGATGIVDTATNEAVVLTVNGSGQVEGRTATSNLLVFVVSVDADGNVTLDQQRSVVHNDPNDHDEPGASAVTLAADNLITLTATITDSDGDTDSATANIGQNLQFEDDGPDAQADGQAALDTLVLDETRPLGTETDGDSDPAGLASTTASFADNFVTSLDYGADGAGTVAYSLLLSGSNVASGLYAVDPTDTSAVDGDGYGRGTQIVMNQAGNTITGSVGATVYFTITIDPATGIVTFTQVNPIWHADTTSDDDTATLTALAGSLLVQQTVTDKDGDNDTASIDLSTGVFRIEDDGPVAVNDSDLITSGGTTVQGNVITGVGTTAGSGSADDVGADVPGKITAISGTGGTDTTFTAGLLSIAGTHGTLTIDADGNYTYTRDDGAPGDAEDVFTYTLTDADGDSTTATLTINIGDAAPNLPDPAIVRLDDDALAGGNPGGTDDDVNSAGLPGQLAGTGGDGDLDYAFTGVNTLPAGFTVNLVDASTLQILQGATVVLTITLDTETGAFNVVQNNPIAHPPGDDENNLSFLIGVEVEDADGDPEPATITINVDDDTPVATSTLLTGTVDEDGVLEGAADNGSGDGIAGGTGDVAGQVVTATGSVATLFSIGADGLGSYSLLGNFAGLIAQNLTSGGVALSYSVGFAAGVYTLTATAGPGGDTVFTFTLNASTGAYNFTLVDQLDHPAGNNENDLTINLSSIIQATDSDGDSVNAGTNGLIITVDDDTPIATNVQLTGTVDEDGVVEDAAVGTQKGDGIAGGTGDVPGEVVAATGSVTTLFQSGADEPLTYSLSNSFAALTAQGLTSGGVALSYSVAFAAGVYMLTATAGPGGNTVFTFTLNATTGAYNFTLVDQLDHPSLNTLGGDNTENDLTVNLSSIIQATDFDGDTVNAGANGLVITVDDDTPTLGTIQDGTAHNNPLATPTVGTLNFEVGADETATGAGAVSSISVNVNGATSGGKAIVTNYSNGVLTAYQDVGPAGYDAGDTTVVFTLTLDPYAGSSGQYVFDLVTPLDPQVTDVPIGGSSAFGAGPTEAQILEHTDGTDLAVVTGYLAGAGFNEATWLASGTASGLTLSSVNGSTAGWGVASNNFEGSEFFNWDFGSGALDTQGGLFTPPGSVTLPDISTATFDFINYTAADDIKYVVHFTDGTFDSGTIPSINLDGSSNDPSTHWVYTAPAGKFIADIEMFASGAAPGKIDLVSVGVQSTSLDVDLDFTVVLTDFDGDQVTGSFTINVDQSNSPSTPESLSSTMMVSQEALVDDSSSTMLMSTESSDEQLKTMSAANNNSVLLGAIAASGLGVSTAAAAAGSAAENNVLLDADFVVDGGVEAQSSYSLDTGGASRAALGGETKEAVEEQFSSASSASASSEAGTNSLTDDGGSEQSQAPAALSQGTEAPQSAPAESNFTSASVGMPSAEMLAAANENGVEGAAKSNGEVGRVLADALAGGGNGPDIDTVLEAMAGGGGQPAIEALASRDAGPVSGWDTAAFAGFPGGHSSVTLDSMTQHFDAVQPAA